MKEITGRRELRVERKREKLCHRLRIGQQSVGTVDGVVAAPLPGSLHTHSHSAGSKAPDSYTHCPFNHRLQLLLKGQETFVMTSFSSSLSGELLQCHICLDVLADPVTTSCGHNFCNVCIEACWESGELYLCPLCKEGFENYICRKHDKPLEMFCRDDQTCLCLFCTETDHKTHTTVSIEEESGDKRIQLEKTQEEIKLMIQDRCKKIEEIKNLAKSNKSTNERNKANKVELFSDLIRSIERCQCELLEVMEQKQKAADNQAEELIKELEQEITELERRDIELEKLSHTEDHLHLLQVYSSVCSPPEFKTWTNININTDLLNTEKALTCLKKKVNKELKKIHEITQPSVIQEFNFIPPTSQPLDMDKMDASITLRTQQGILTEISSIKTSNDQTEGKIYFTLGKTDCGTRSKKAGYIKQVNVSWFGLGLSALKQLYAVDVILDPNTAHPKLALSKDRKQVSHGEFWRDVPNNPERFDTSPCVLGMDGFSCGRFYFEVQVSDKTEWDLGMAQESIKRKGKITMRPEKGFWCIWLRNGREYVANESHPVPLSLKDKPQKVGVFVDYEEGLVSFYNVETKVLIYSFTGQSFTKKIYPFFSPCNKRGDINSEPLIIYTVS
ncbi:E3 ubiquitin-protein ligase TRIM39-like [Garra rufa]|uniref:E3 ubiquitin-protein ligase TRIM39-like n=1 Tax=Garra rufa TaxID=137080 RepID=UPI003CCE59C8